MKESPAAQTYRNARREAIVTLCLFAAVCIYSVGVCYWLGYNRPADELKLIWGIPDWVFYGVLVPWILMLPVTGWFCFRFMADDDLSAKIDPEDSQR